MSVSATFYETSQHQLLYISSDHDEIVAVVGVFMMTSSELLKHFGGLLLSCLWLLFDLFHM